MQVNFIRWDDSPDLYQDKIGFGKIISRIRSDSCPNAVCDVSLSPDRSGITISFRETPNPAPIISLVIEKSREPGVVEAKVRKALADAADPTRVERELLGGEGVDS